MAPHNVRQIPQGVYLQRSDMPLWLQVLKDLYRRLVQQGLRLVCIVTKVDLVDPEVQKDVVNVMTSQQVHLLRQFVSVETGMPVNQVPSSYWSCCLALPLLCGPLALSPPYRMTMFFFLPEMAIFATSISSPTLTRRYQYRPDTPPLSARWDVTGARNSAGSMQGT